MARGYKGGGGKEDVERAVFFVIRQKGIRQG